MNIIHVVAVTANIQFFTPLHTTIIGTVLAEDIYDTELLLFEFSLQNMKQ